MTTSNHYGATLIELLIAMSILTFILGAVLVLHLQGTKIYQDVAASDWATFDAATAVEMMEKDIEGSFRVLGRFTNHIYLAMPRMTYDNDAGCEVPVEPLTWGDIVHYYLSDDTGHFYRNGTYLWRSVLPYGGSSFIRDAHPLADNITTLQFSYEMLPAPRQHSVKTVTVLVRAEVKEGGATKTRTHTARLTLRNASYGPVTREPGNYNEEE